MPCTYCDVQFSVLKWKTRCNYCSRKYCSDCIVEGKCKSCYQVSSTNFQRSQLSRLKVKDLRLYLENRNCSTATLKEKSEFITTIQQLQGIHEPEYANMHLYNTHYSTHHQQTVTNQMQGAPYHNIPTEDCMMQGFDPPTYEHTQESFPSAHDFVAAEQSTTSTSERLSKDKQTNSKPHTKKDGLLELSDLTSVDEIGNLSVQQLKHLLKTNLVDFKGVLEKNELVQRVVMLYNDHQSDIEMLSEEKMTTEATFSGPKDENLCKICWEKAMNCVYLECGHMVTCIDCKQM
ncbi:unnamed protein product [Clavelina lepadiformis]|uniref:Uncharacterized protein n=1 Tax=Clavelina lepadiformis TaxID=159417 RepID=A0ABP0G0R8_CLALP